MCVCGIRELSASMKMEGTGLHITSGVSRKLTRVAALASAAALVVGLAACSGGGEQANSPQKSRILKVGSAAALNSLDPARIAVGADAFLFPVYEPLVRRDSKALFQPGLATEWKLSEDAKQLSLTLREGVKFQDGTPFNADAVKVNLDAAPSRGGSITSQLSIVTAVDVVDEQHVTLSLSRPASDILGVLASGAGMMISPEALGTEDLGTKPVGTGPFTLDQFTENKVSFKAWDGYWDKDRIKLDGIEFQRLDDAQTRLNAVLTDEIQVAMVMPYSQVAEQKERAPDTVVSEIGNRAYAVALWVNSAEGDWANPAMRKAAMHAIDREGISSALYGDGGCEPVAQPFPSSFWAYDQSLTDSDDARFDPDLAHQLLEDAGLIGTQVKIYAGSVPVYQNMAAAVQEQLNAVGMDVTVEALDTGTLSDLRSKGQFEASIAVVEAGRPDPATFAQQFYTTDGVFNYGHQVYEGIEEPLAGINATADQEERAGYMHEIMKLVLEQGPGVIPICSPTQVTMHSADVAGIEVWLDNDNDYTGAYFTNE